MTSLWGSTGYLYKITAVLVSNAITLQSSLVGAAQAASQPPPRQPLSSLPKDGALGLLARV
jgi:hypothetical protein